MYSVMKISVPSTVLYDLILLQVRYSVTSLTDKSFAFLVYSTSFFKYFLWHSSSDITQRMFRTANPTVYLIE